MVDLMHGLEPQTIESLNLLRKRKTPFVVALNKVDRVYGWKPKAGSPIQASLAEQEEYAISEFEDRTKRVLTQLAEQGLNAKLYYENDDFRRVVSVVPTSAHTGEGIADLLMLLIQLTQQLMSKKIMFSSVVECTVLEVKTVEGLGTTVDVVLVNGTLSRGDTIVLCGMNGPIVTQIRALLTPQPLRELRVKVRSPFLIGRVLLWAWMCILIVYVCALWACDQACVCVRPCVVCVCAPVRACLCDFPCVCVCCERVCVPPPCPVTGRLHAARPHRRCDGRQAGRALHGEGCGGHAAVRRAPRGRGGGLEAGGDEGL